MIFAGRKIKYQEKKKKKYRSRANTMERYNDDLFLFLSLCSTIYPAIFFALTREERFPSWLESITRDGKQNTKERRWLFYL